MGPVKCVSYVVERRRTYSGRWFNYYIIFVFSLTTNKKGKNVWRKGRWLSEATTIKKTIKLLKQCAEQEDISYILTPDQIQNHFNPVVIEVLDLTDVFK